VTSSESEGDEKSVTEGHTRGRDQTPRNPSILGYWQKAIVTRNTNEAKKAAGLTFGDGGSQVYSGYQRSVDDDETAEKMDHLGIAFDIAREKSLRKAIDYLIACNILTPSPRDIASFLRIHRADLRPSDLGKYLGEGGSTGSETEYWNLIRFSYIRAISFVGMTVEKG
jgi:hypothetical protein